MCICLQIDGRHDMRTLLQAAQPTPLSGDINPKKMNAYIQQQSQAAARAAKTSDPNPILLLYFKRMAQMCHDLGRQLDHIHISTILYGTATVIVSIDEECKDQQLPKHAQQELEAFLRFMLDRLQLVLPDIKARGASGILWSFAKIGINPDTLVPGTVDKVAQQYTCHIKTAVGTSYASLLWACAELNLNPCQGQLLQKALGQLERAELSQYKAHELANIVYSLAKMPTVQPSISLLNGLCRCFLKQLLSSVEDQQPTAQGVANFVWALQKLKYLPIPQLTSAMLARMLRLCQDTAQQRPTSQNIANFLLGCAVLRVRIQPAEAQALMTQLLSCSKLQNKQLLQHLVNSTWALAVTGQLQISMFRLVLQRVSALAPPSVPLREAHMDQLHRTLHRLHPSADASAADQTAWQEAQAELQQLGPMPFTPETVLLAKEEVGAALQAMGLDYTAAECLEAYWVDAIVWPQIPEAPPLIVLVEDPDWFMNEPSR